MIISMANQPGAAEAHGETPADTSVGGSHEGGPELSPKPPGEKHVGDVNTHWFDVETKY